MKQHDRQADATHQRIVIAQVALAIGVVVFAGIICMTKKPGEWRHLPMMVIASIGMTCMAAPMRLAGPAIVRSSGVKSVATANKPEDDFQGLLQVYASSAIVAGAMLEGVGILNLIVYMMEQNPINLALAAAMVALILSTIPSRHAMRSWIDEQQNVVRSIRSKVL